MMGSCWAGHWMGRQISTNEMYLMVWLGSEWWHGRQKGAATPAAYIVKDIGYLKDNSERG